MVLFNVCSAITVECCGLYLCLLLCKEEGSSPVSVITEMRNMGLYEVPMSGFGMGTMLANFHKCCIMFWHINPVQDHFRGNHIFGF